LALGGEANLYWLWRQHRAGQELMHGSVVSAAGRPLHIFGEVQQLGREFKQAGEFLRGTRPTISGLGLIWSQRVARMFQFQATVKPEFNYEQTLGEAIYHPLLRAQYRPDILQPGADLSPYRLLLCPLLMTLEERGLRERLEAWVEAGGTLIAGPLTDVRDHEGAHYAHATLGVLEDWGGAYCRYSLPGFPLDFASTWQADGHTGTGQVWYDGLEPRGAEALAVYSEGPLKGLASITRQRKGRGQVILLGTLPSPEDLRLLIETTAAEHGVQPIAAAAPNVLVVPRTGTGGPGCVAMEWDCAPGGWLMLNKPRRDLLSGETLQGRVEFAPYQVRVLVP
jgi:beta-galactosidase GanA